MKRVILKSGVNKNGVYFSKEVIEKAMEDYKPLIEGRAAIGVINDGNLLDDKIKIKDASHIIADFEMKDGEVIADIEILNTPCGNEIRKFIEDGGEVETRFRGIGIINNKNEVEELKIASFDLVKGE